MAMVPGTYYTDKQHNKEVKDDIVDEAIRLLADPSQVQQGAYSYYSTLRVMQSCCPGGARVLSLLRALYR